MDQVSEMTGSKYRILGTPLALEGHDRAT